MLRLSLVCSAILTLTGPLPAQALPGTKLLEGEQDFAAVMVEGIEKYLDRMTADSVKTRQERWKMDYSSPEAYLKSVNPNRERLRRMIGAGDSRLPVKMEMVGDTQHAPLLAQSDQYKVYVVRWPVLPGVYGEGLLLEPTGKPKAFVVAIPDADMTPESCVGLNKDFAPDFHFARKLVLEGCKVIVPTLINRQDTYSGSAKLGRFTNQTHREFIYRMSFEMGRHIIGYEVQKVLAAVDWFAQTKDHPPIGVYGYGEGGLLALYSGALDTRIKSTVVSGHFKAREKLYDEPIYRNVHGLLREFGDGELLRLIMPRHVIIEQSHFEPGPAPAETKERRGAAPGKLHTPEPKLVTGELDRIFKNVPKLDQFKRAPVQMFYDHQPKGEPNEGPPRLMGPGQPRTLDSLCKNLLGTKYSHTDPKETPNLKYTLMGEARQKRQFDELVDHTQKLLHDAPSNRQGKVWAKLDYSSLEKFQKSQEPVREQFWQDLMGKLPEPTMPLNPRTRKIFDQPKWVGYEVVLDVYDDVISYGVLLVPKDIKDGEKRPCVVCQHGLEGRPIDVVNPKEKTAYYNSFGAQLADQGFVVFAPQNPYIFKNKFRQVVRKAYPNNLTLYAFIIRQHERILDWLQTLPFVDGQRIAYYGLSYGGKVAMRIPAVLTRYCLSICSGDFNEWIWKNINLDWIGSYMFTLEYEMYEFDLGNTFNYAEMAALIAPRPFMVERGHSDGVGLDEYVAFEYAKVRRLYARLGIADRTEIEFFTGGHEIHLRGTLAFLQRHLNFPAKK